jgi:hypothetical protein
MVAPHQVEPAVEQRCLAFDIFPPAKRQISDVKDNLFRLNQVVPVINDHLLPAIRTIAIAADVLVEEMGVGNDPGFVIKGADHLTQVDNLPAADCLSPRLGTRFRQIGSHAPANRVSE